MYPPPMQVVHKRPKKLVNSSRLVICTSGDSSNKVQKVVKQGYIKTKGSPKNVMLSQRLRAESQIPKPKMTIRYFEGSHAENWFTKKPGISKALKP